MNDSTLIIDEGDRYAGLRLIAWWDQARLAAARVLVVGAGALGNEVLKNFALLGIGAVYIVDFDCIEAANLTRGVLFRARDCGRPKVDAAAEMLRDLNPDVRVTPLKADVLHDVGLGLFREVDVVVGCLDNREARLWVNRACWKTGTPWIDGGIQEISGVVKVFVPPDSACYECAMTEMDYLLIQLRYSCPLLKQEDILAGKVPTAPTISSIIAGLQTQEALKLLHGMPTAAGAAMVFNGEANRFYTTAFQRQEDCLSHETYPAPMELPLSADDTAAALFAAVRGHFPDAAALTLALDRDLVVSFDCPACGGQRPVMRPAGAVPHHEATCPACGAATHPHLEYAVPETSPLAAKKLSELGVPPYDMVRVAAAGGAQQCVLLAGDRRRILGE